MSKNIALAVLLSTSILATPAYAQDEMFRSQLKSPIYFSMEASGTPGGEYPSDPVPVILDLAGHAFPEFEVGDTFSHDFKDQLTISGDVAGEVDWSLGMPNNMPTGLAWSNGSMEGEFDEEGEYGFQIIASHPDVENPAQMLYTIVVNGIELQLIQIETGFSHTCGLTTQHIVYCWGDNSTGQLGTNKSGGYKPALIPGLHNISQISVGRMHTCALNDGGKVYCWGENIYNQLGSSDPANHTPFEIPNLSEIIQISSGGRHTCALTSSKNVYCWGSNENYQSGSTGNDSYIPTIIKGVNSQGVLSNVAQISSGDRHTCASSISGIYCWGRNNNSRQLGYDGGDSSTPIKIGDLSSPIKISAGGLHTCALMNNRRVYCWGGNGNGRLGHTGNSSSPPTQVQGGEAGGAYLSNVIDISVNGHSCAATSDGTAYCWGHNGSGQFGTGNTFGQANSPMRILAGETGDDYISGISKISAGSNYTCALNNDGDAFCWGNGGNGRLGSPSSSLIPVRVSNP